MKATTTLHVTLELTAEEAAWLHELMRNPLTEDQNPDYEDPYDKKMREAFYWATAFEGQDHS